jgi:hypothetical protein
MVYIVCLSFFNNCRSGNYSRIRNSFACLYSDYFMCFFFATYSLRRHTYANLLIDVRLHREGTEIKRENSLNETIFALSLYLFFTSYAHACASIYSCAQAQSKVSLFDYNWWCSTNIIHESNPKIYVLFFSFFFSFSFFSFGWF